MTDSEKAIYIAIRSEQIQRFQNQKNGHLFTKPYPIEDAVKVATNQLNCDLKNGKLRISLEELLLNDDATCQTIIENKNREFINILNGIKDL